MQRVWTILAWLGVILASLSGGAAGEFRADREPGRLILRGPAGHPLITYQMERPRGSLLAVESGCFFHPFNTPSGVPLTDLAPSDHPHHRGIFLGWVEMHGRKNADFWGWGEHAPTQDCRIVSRGISGLRTRSSGVGFRARNEWMAGDDPLVREDLEVQARVVEGANVVDLTYRLRTDEDMVLAQWAFGGFCVRARKDGSVVAHGPRGVVALANPSHLKPETDWPDAPWYAFQLALPENVLAGVAVMSHPKNPPTLWHNHRDIRILNPAITARGPVTLPAKKTMILRYRVVAFDGAVPRGLLDTLAAELAGR